MEGGQETPQQNKSAEGTLHVAAVETGSFVSKWGYTVSLDEQMKSAPRRAAVVKIQDRSPLSLDKGPAIC